MRFDTKDEDGPAGEGGERYYNYVMLVRGGDVVETPDGDPEANDTALALEFNGGDEPAGGAPHKETVGRAVCWTMQLRQSSWA